MDHEVKEFFARYERANAASDVPAIGDLYAGTFMFADPNSVRPVSKEDFLKVIPAMKARYSAMGISHTALHSVTITPLDPRYLSATVVWRITLHHPTGQYLDTSATYILARQPDNALAIILQLDHQHLATVLQNLPPTHQPESRLTFPGEQKPHHHLCSTPKSCQAPIHAKSSPDPSISSTYDKQILGILVMANPVS